MTTIYILLATAAIILIAGVIYVIGIKTENK
jgi:hypothetical protein